MNISLNWLTDYVEVAMPAAELEQLFTRIGLNHEGTSETPTDLVLDLEVTSNRPDCLGHIGVARELAVATGKAFTPPALKDVATAGKASELTGVDVQAPDLCPRYSARVIRGVKIGPSPEWLVERLEAIGMRSVNNIVDVTNFILMEYSQPLHAFDYDKLAENRIVVRRARGGERMVSIDETTCDLDESMLVIADANKPVAIAGVMGGLDTEVSDETVNILLESAQFDPLNIRHTSRKLALMSESNFRFERGVDPVALDEASLRACQMIVELAGGELAEGSVDVWADPYEAPTVTMRPARCSALLGFDIPADEQASILDRLGLAAVLEGDTITCTIPPYRADLTREADLIEEVARIVGYDKIPLATKIAHEVVGMDDEQKIRQDISLVLAASGFDEAITFTYIDVEEAALFGVDKPACADTLTRKTNNALRPTLLPSLLAACKANQDSGNSDISLYELAAAFMPTGSENELDEHLEIAMVTSSDLRDLRGAVEALCEQIATGASLELRPSAQPGMDSDAAAEMLLNGNTIGVIGRISADVLKHYGIERPLAAARLRMDVLKSCAHLERTYSTVPRFPAVRRDLSLVVDEETTWAQIQEVLTAIDQPLRTDVQYVTTYRGKPITAGRKSVTLTVVYQSNDATLRSEQVDEQITEIVTALAGALKAEVRT
ncbi:MAG: phenylalanine--tRNA ligase subunit beta [Phycisphaerae bacterium]|jgi:phenylalanyl-tRNA synthetase beta chain|nr:phenylalanine--tRNA ligase subunit beta [Phycisphaerae bacterium]